MSRRMLIAVALCSMFSFPAPTLSQTTATPSTWLQGWPMEGHDPQRTNQSPAIGPTHPRLLFQRKATSIYLASSDGTVYGFAGGQSSTTRRLIALNAGGRVRWAHRRCAQHLCGSTFMFGVSPQGTLVGLTQAPGDIAAVVAFQPNGSLKWKIEPAGPQKGGVPAITEAGELYFLLAKTDGNLCQGVNVLEADSGSVLRCPRIDFGVATLGPDGAVYEAGTSMTGYGPDGRELWETKLSDVKPPVYLTLPLLAQNGLIYAGVGTTLSAVTKSGHLLWQVTKPDGAWSLAAGANSTVLAAGSRSLAMYSPDGKLIWEEPIGPPGTWDDMRPSLVTDAAGTAYVGAADGKVRIFSPDGKLLQRLSVGPKAPFPASAILANGKLIVDGTDGTLRVYGK